MHEQRFALKSPRTPEPAREVCCAETQHCSGCVLCGCCCCRFGAEDLFAAAEVGSAERSRRLLEEDIDDILLRSEVVGQQPGQQSVAGGASDLLSSFNVATFKVCTALRRHGTSACLMCTCPVARHARGVVGPV